MESPGAPAGGGGTISDVLQSALPGILKRGKVITSPYPFGLGDDDNLRVTAVNSVAGVTVNVHTRRVLRDLSVTADTPTFTPPANRTPTSIDVPLAGGYVTNLSAFASGAAVRKGQCFVIVQMIRGLGVSATILGTLLAGTITATQSIGWPGSPIESSTDGEPVVRTIVGTQPAVGSDFIETVPTGARWEILTFSALYQTATASNRNVALLIDDGATVFATSPGASLALATSYLYQWWPNYNAFATQNTNPPSVTGGVPENLKLLAGARIRSSLGVYQPGDQWAAPVFTVREWQEAA